MGFSFIEKIDKSDEINEKNELDRYINEAEDMISRFANVSDDTFPSFTWNVLINDYGEGDAYRRLNGFDETDPEGLEIIRAAMNLRRKYGDYHDFQDALVIYQDYLRYLKDVHGAYAFLYNLSNTGVKVRRPMLKDTAENKMLSSFNIQLSRPDKSEKVNFSEIAHLDTNDLLRYHQDFGTSYTNELDGYFTISERSNIHRIDEVARLNNMRRGRGTASSDAMINFLTSDANGIRVEEFSETTLNTISDIIAKDISNYGKSQEEINEIENPIISKIHPGHRVNMNMSQADIDYRKIMDELYRNGWDVSKMSSLKTIDKSSRTYVLQKRKLRDMLGGGPLDEDDVKNMQKEERRIKKERAERERENKMIDETLSNAFLNNSLDVEDDDDFIKFLNNKIGGK